MYLLHIRTADPGNLISQKDIPTDPVIARSGRSSTTGSTTSYFRSMADTQWQ